MTRTEALSLAIARHFEPVPIWTKWMHDQQWNTSDGRFWNGYRDDPSDDAEPIEAHCRKITEPEIAMRLQVLLYNDGLFEPPNQPLVPEWSAEQFAVYIAECFTLAHGLEVSE